jgi:hypothetical protein
MHDVTCFDPCAIAGRLSGFDEGKQLPVGVWSMKHALEL